MPSPSRHSNEEKENIRHSISDNDKSGVTFPTPPSVGSNSSTGPATTDHAPSSRVSVASSATSASLESAQQQQGGGTASLKQKRSTVFHGSEAFKAKTNQKPFSESAAKRESVMALGSIGHLQNFYAKQGL